MDNGSIIRIMAMYGFLIFPGLHPIVQTVTGFIPNMAGHGFQAIHGRVLSITGRWMRDNVYGRNAGSRRGMGACMGVWGELSRKLRMGAHWDHA